MQAGGGYSQVCGIQIFSDTHGQGYLLPIGQGTDEHSLSFISWLLIRIELLALLMQTVVA